MKQRNMIYETHKGESWEVIKIEKSNMLEVGKYTNIKNRERQF